MRKKDEEWPRTGTFCAAWGRISVMQWPIFTGHFEALWFRFHLSGLKMLSLMCVYVGIPTCMYVKAVGNKGAFRGNIPGRARASQS